jgi:energy-coupling factor transporter transmembrane protein EcfT
MNSISPISFYIPRISFLHRLHITGKLIILLFYAIGIFILVKPLATLLFYIVLVGSIILLRFPVRNRIMTGVTFCLLVVIILTSSQQTILGRFVLAISKVLCLYMVIALFTMTTRLNSILQLLGVRERKFNTLYQLVYVINTTLAVAPSIQYDLQRAIDSETIRRGKRIGFISFESWLTILTITLVRILNRTERFTDTVLDRGFVPSQRMHTLSERPINKKDWLLTALMILPGMIIWILMV